MKGISDPTPSLSQCAQYMSFVTVPDYINTIGGNCYDIYSYPKMIITDTSLTCSVKKWKIVTNYPS